MSILHCPFCGTMPASVPCCTDPMKPSVPGVVCQNPLCFNMGRHWPLEQWQKQASAETLNSAGRAINHILCRIRDDERVQYHLGAGTQTYELLTAAAARLFGKPVAEVRNQFIPGSADLHNEEAA